MNKQDLKAIISKTLNEININASIRVSPESRRRNGVFVYWYNRNKTKQTSFISLEDDESDIENMFTVMNYEGVV